VEEAVKFKISFRADFDLFAALQTFAQPFERVSQRLAQRRDRKDSEPAILVNLNLSHF
jgi:hypothetical protein